MKRVGLDIDGDLAGYVTKPFGPHELLNAVTDVLIKHHKPIPPRLNHQPAETARAQSIGRE